MTVQFRLKELLAERERVKGEKISYRDLRDKAGLSTNTITRIANNEVKMIGIKTIARLCEALECKPGDLIVLAEVE